MTRVLLIEPAFALKQADVTDSNLHMKYGGETEAAAFGRLQQLQLVFLSNLLIERKQD